jgi:high-affinity iron transporter
MGAAFVIALREGIEAALIVSIVLAYLKQLGRTDRSRLVWLGTALAVLLSAATGTVIFAVGADFEGTAERVFEGLVTLTAVGVLTWMIFWMRRQARFIRGELQERVDVALASGSALALPALAFVVVVREGLETVLFLFGTIREEVTGSVALGYVGAALGLATAVVLGYLIYRGGVRLNLRTFFKVTGGLILVVAAGLLAGGIHELQEIAWLPGESATAFNVAGTLSDETGIGAFLRAMFGYNANPSWLELGAWVLYLAATGFLFFRPQPAMVARPAGPEAADTAAQRP